jgi:hypothetical protein
MPKLIWMAAAAVAIAYKYGAAGGSGIVKPLYLVPVSEHQLSNMLSR